MLQCFVRRDFSRSVFQTQYSFPLLERTEVTLVTEYVLNMCFARAHRVHGRKPVIFIGNKLKMQIRDSLDIIIDAALMHYITQRSVCC